MVAIIGDGEGVDAVQEHGNWRAEIGGVAANYNCASTLCVTTYTGSTRKTKKRAETTASV